VRLFGQTQFSRDSLPTDVTWVDLTWIDSGTVTTVAELEAVVDAARLEVTAGPNGIFVALPEWAGSLLAQDTADAQTSTKVAWPILAAPLPGMLSRRRTSPDYSYW
jgi:hypothetical protein